MSLQCFPVVPRSRSGAQRLGRPHVLENEAGLEVEPQYLGNVGGQSIRCTASQRKSTLALETV